MLRGASKGTGTAEDHDVDDNVDEVTVALRSSTSIGLQLLQRSQQANGDQQRLYSAIGDVKAWAESLDLQSRARARSSPNITCLQLAKLCNVIGWMHEDTNVLVGQMREALDFQKLAFEQLNLLRKSGREDFRKLMVAVDRVEENMVDKRTFHESSESLRKSQVRFGGLIADEQRRVTEAVQSLYDEEETRKQEVVKMVDQIRELECRCDQQTRRLLDEHKRADNSSHRLEKATCDLECFKKTLDNHDSVREAYDLVARTLRDIGHELRELHLTQRMQGDYLTSARAWMDSSKRGGEGGVVGDHRQVKNLTERIFKLECSQTQLLLDQKLLQDSVTPFKQSRVDIVCLEERQEECERNIRELEISIREGLASVMHQADQTAQEQAKNRVEEFVTKWGLFREANHLAIGFSGWKKYMRRRQNMRDALKLSKDLHTKTHISARLRCWAYVSQKDHIEGKVRHMSELANTQRRTIETLGVSVSRCEKSFTDMNNSFRARFLGMEKSIDDWAAQKADKVFCEKLVQGVSKRLEYEFDLTPLRDEISEVSRYLKLMQRTKMDAERCEQKLERLADQIAELQGLVRKHDMQLENVASADTVNSKAEAVALEQVALLLSKQADSLSHSVSAELERIRITLVRFLQLSPDLRKGALSVGLEPNERCLTCSVGQKEPPTAVGADGKVYRVAGDAEPHQGGNAVKLFDELFHDATAQQVSGSLRQTTPRQESAPSRPSTVATRPSTAAARPSLAATRPSTAATRVSVLASRATGRQSQSSPEPAPLASGRSSPLQCGFVTNNCCQAALPARAGMELLEALPQLQKLAGMLPGLTSGHTSGCVARASTKEAEVVEAPLGSSYFPAVAPLGGLDG